MRYLVAGAGPAGVIAAETLRRSDPAGDITLLGDESEAPYSRMALPYLLAGNIDEGGTHLRHGAGHYDKLGITLRRERLSALAPADKTVTLAGGEVLPYDKLLIATGSHTIRPPLPGMDSPGIENCWTLADARNIAERAGPGSEVVLMGAGFIGCIVLEALVARKVKLTVVEMEHRMLARMMDETGATMMRKWCESRGIKVLTGTRVSGVESKGGKLNLTIQPGAPLSADLIVCATGVRPNVDFLEGSGVRVEQGIVVDRCLQTGVDHIYAAGDVAQGPDFSTGKPQVHAIQPTASEHGRVAARNMAGHETPFRGSLSMNVLNTLGLVSSSFGLWDGVGGERAEIVDHDRFRYLRLEFDGDFLVGALALGLTQHVGVLRGLIQTRVNLGRCKPALLRDPHQVMHVYLDRTQGVLA